MLNNENTSLLGFFPLPIPPQPLRLAHHHYRRYLVRILATCGIFNFNQFKPPAQCFGEHTESETSCEEAARLTAEGADADDDDYEFAEIPPPPDGGYGWVVVFASFMCNMVVDGIAYTFGIFLPQLVLSFGEGKGTVAWCGSLLSGVNLSAGEFNTSMRMSAALQVYEAIRWRSNLGHRNVSVKGDYTIKLR
ncbi:Monocarboxylate transporter 9 [Eumeta japonica]|uniref:Monocarboxylate transporter 9 n=1 Tax=Eumeta variegata TaxID=151549 RepID=A0A4C1U3Q6_EUMVA|nr:Monocarboxylate transporter 9 [Eumeta japonica]